MILAAGSSNTPSGGALALIGIVVALIILGLIIKSILIVVTEYERAVFFRLGRIREGRRDLASWCGSPRSTAS